MTKPNITIIVPCYNAEATLSTALTSILQQTESKLQIIVVDDSSTDASPDIISHFKRKDKRIESFTNSQNLGVADTKNLGLSLASGKYVGFLDADDWLHPNFLRNLFHDIEEMDVDFIRCNHIRANKLARSIEEAPQAKKYVRLRPRDSIGPVSKKTMLDYPYAGTGLYKTDMMHKLRIQFQEGLRSAEDRLFFLRLFYEASSYAVTAENGYFYRKETTDTLTTNGSASQLHIFRAISAMLEYCDKYVHETSIHIKVTEMSLALIHFHVKNRSRLTPKVNSQLNEEIKSIKLAFNNQLFRQVLDTATPERRKILNHIFKKKGFFF